MTRQEVTVDAILFDMDGTLVDSTPAVDRTYITFAQANGIQLDRHPHGIRTADNMRTWFPHAQPEEIATRTVQFEEDIVSNARALEAEGKTGLVILSSVTRVLQELRSNPKSEQHYAICTSATHIYASAALKTAGIRAPSHFITADDCVHGKPHPEPYLKGAKTLGFRPEACLVVEDAPSGIKSGLAAGCTVLAVCTSHSRQELQTLGAHFLVDNLDSVSLEWTQEEQIRVSVQN